MSAKDKIIVLPNPRLRQRSKRVPAITSEVRAIIKQMIESTIDWENSREHEVGVALAAVQIDLPYKIVIVRNDFENKDDKTFSIFINPEIVKKEGQIEEDYEGCLSVTDIYGKVPRYSKVRVRALDENGQPVRVKAEGFLARIFQHEIDHCNGLVFVDHIKDKKDAFYKLTDNGKLEPLPYEQAEKANVFQT
ncbi:MAG TPA: peptide deformylase [Candidatus Saccharimonadales bacterium]|nr:peptide deformylase [Candidatus Saccharimonadales bacterium]